MKASQQLSSHTRSLWGSGLLAVDFIMRTDESEAFEITAGGTCANVLANLAHFGWHATARGRVGDDTAGHVLSDHLDQAGVNVATLVFDERVETPIIVERIGIGSRKDPSHRFEWRCPKCRSHVPRFRATPIAMAEIDQDSVSPPDVFFFDRPTPSNLRTARAFLELGTTIMFEPPRLKVAKEFEIAVGLADIVKIADCNDRAVIENWLRPNSLAILTHGPKGLSYRASDFRGITTDWVSQPAFDLTSVLDSCGSGDWLTTGFLHAFFAVDDLTEDVPGKLAAALKFGQALASLNCMLPGARGLSRVFDHAEISDMVAVTLAKGLSVLESRIEKRSTTFGKLRDIRTVCNSCQSSSVG